MSLLKIVYCWADANDNSSVWMIVIMCVWGTQQTSQDGQKKDTPRILVGA